MNNEISNIKTLSKEFKPGTITIIAGAPISFKSQLCYAIIYELDRQNKQSVIYELESPENWINWHLELYGYDKRIKDTVSVCPNSDFTDDFNRIRSYIIQQRELGKECHCLFLDDIACLEITHSDVEKNKKYDLVIREMKQLAVELNIAVIGIIPLGADFIREGNANYNRMPLLLDLDTTEYERVNLFVFVRRPMEYNGNKFPFEADVEYPDICVVDNIGEAVGRFSLTWNKEERRLK